MNPYLVIVFPTILVALLHSMQLDHWMPYVVTARARKWPLRTVLLMALSGALAHLISTTLVGAALILCGEGLKAVFAKGLQYGVGVVVTIVGLWFIYRGLQILKQRETHAEHCGHHERTILVKENGAHQHAGGSRAGASFFLGAVYGLRPCLEAMGLFLKAASYPISVSVLTVFGWAVASVAGMVGVVWLGTVSLERLRIDKLEKYNELLTGLIIAVIGIYSLFSLD